jgi:hypothetical protein
MNSITLIPSVIMTPNTPLSYTNTRSVYSREERFEQTKLSISSAREKIPGTRILLHRLKRKLRQNPIKN